jgi:hypothetical protein
MLYYFSGGYEEAPVNYDYTTAINGQVKLTAYPRKNTIWTDEDLL